MYHKRQRPHQPTCARHPPPRPTHPPPTLSSPLPSPLLSSPSLPPLQSASRSNRAHQHQLHLAPLPTVLPELRLPDHLRLTDRMGLGIVAPELLQDGGSLDVQLDNMFRYFTAPFRADRRVLGGWDGRSC